MLSADGNLITWSWLQICWSVDACRRLRNWPSRNCCATKSDLQASSCFIVCLPLSEPDTRVTLNDFYAYKHIKTGPHRSTTCSAWHVRLHETILGIDWLSVTQALPCHGYLCTHSMNVNNQPQSRSCRVRRWKSADGSADSCRTSGHEHTRRYRKTLCTLLPCCRRGSLMI